jgi:hypothetical protein
MISIILEPNKNYSIHKTFVANQPSDSVICELTVDKLHEIQSMIDETIQRCTADIDRAYKECNINSDNMTPADIIKALEDMNESIQPIDRNKFESAINDLKKISDACKTGKVAFSDDKELTQSDVAKMKNLINKTKKLYDTAKKCEHEFNVGYDNIKKVIEEPDKDET